MARDRAGTREAYAAKTRAEIASLAEQGVLFAGNAFSSVTLVKGEPEKDGAAPFSGPDGRALRDALMALGYAPEDWSALLSCDADGVPHMVLIRALQPETGLETMKARRAADGMLNLCSGPGKLCKAMGIDRSLYGERLWQSSRLFVEDTLHTPPVLTTPRIGIDYAERCKNEPWRFVWAGSEYLSRPWKKELQLLQQTEKETSK